MTTTGVSDPLVGQVLDGRYEILARLARGGMATVYRALDLRLTRTVAIKVMHDGLGDDTDFAKKFDREARAAATLSNQHVVSVFDQGTDRGRPYIVMEFVDGCTLRHVITREAPMAPLRALDLIEPVVHALATAHDNNLIHRDVKPENVLISDRGQVKVADFGLARAVTAQTATATQGLLIGTVSYLPPELVTKARADARGDVYSTGVVLFEMLTGRKPHTGDTPIAVAWSHVHNDIPAPSTLLTEQTDSRRIIPPYLDALVVACTRRQPADRPKDARELLALVRTCRKALAKGILDDPKLTAAMLASTRHDATLDEDTVADPEARPEGMPAPAHPFVRPQSAASAASASVMQRGHTPVSPIDRVPAPTPSLDEEFTVTSRRGGDFPVPQPPVRPLPSAARQPVSRTPRSPRTPIFPNISHAPVHRRRRGLVLFLLLLLVTAVVAAVAYTYVSTKDWLGAPALVNVTSAEAQTVAANNGLTVVTEEAHSETVPKGTVISVDPPAGTRVKKGSTLHLVVSAGPERFEVPKLAGLTLGAAKSALSAGNLTVGKVTEAWDEKVPAGTVVDASQAPGVPLKRGTKVDLVVSKGPKPIPVTSHVGSDAESAKAVLSKAGFEVHTSEAHSDTVAKGRVISQDPRSGEGKRGDVVSLVVSKGPQLFEVPRVVGRSEAAASEKLRQAGFKVAVVYNTAAWMRLDVVAAQKPAKGDLVPKGTAITIYVS